MTLTKENAIKKKIARIQNIISLNQRASSSVEDSYSLNQNQSKSYNFSTPNK